MFFGPSQVMLENMINRFNTNLWSSCRLNAANKKEKKRRREKLSIKKFIIFSIPWFTWSCDVEHKATLPPSEYYTHCNRTSLISDFQLGFLQNPVHLDIIF